MRGEMKSAERGKEQRELQFPCLIRPLFKAVNLCNTYGQKATCILFGNFPLNNCEPLTSGKTS